MARSQPGSLLNVHDNGRVLFSYDEPAFVAWVNARVKACWAAAGNPMRPAWLKGGARAPRDEMKMYVGTNSMYVYGRIAAAMHPFPVGMTSSLITVADAKARVGRSTEGAAALYVYRRDVLGRRPCNAGETPLAPAGGEFSDLADGEAPFVMILPE